MSLYYENLPRCSKCGLITKLKYIKQKRLTKNGLGLPYCTVEECEAPDKCHGQVGIGSATLGSHCVYPEGHLKDNIPHSYGTPDFEFGNTCCNAHPEGCPK